MRGLIVLCLSALTAAAPQGYNYPSQSGGQFVGPAAGVAATLSSSHDNGAAGTYNYQQQQPLVSKRFFIHSAPEEDEVEIQHKDIVIGTPRKNFNVVFIKSPSSKQQLAKIRVIPAVNEEKTVIYVLAKKTDGADVIAHVEEPATTTSKPEVFFIKYKTNEEAEHAQHSIQAEYDRLGGSTIVSNEGISPVSSVIGSLDSFRQNGAGAGFGATSGAGFGAASGAGFGATSGAGFGSTSGAGFGTASDAGYAGAVVGPSAGASHGSASSAYLPPVKKH